MCLGIPGRIVKIDDAARMLATVDVGGVKRQVNIACIVDEEHDVSSCVGDWVLIHVGFAMSRIDEAEAAETLKILIELGEAQAELDAMHVSAVQAGGDVIPSRGEPKTVRAVGPGSTTVSGAAG